MDSPEQLLYLGENAVWSSRSRLTLPSSIFDEYGILSRDRGGWWIYDSDVGEIRIANKAPDTVVGVARYAELSDPGDGGKTRFFTIPEQFRHPSEADEQVENIQDDREIPTDLRFDTQNPVHFVTERSTLERANRSFGLYTIEQLESKVNDGATWANDAKSIARLLDSNASHLLETTDIDVREPAVDGPNTTLYERLQIEDGNVPDEFSIEQTTVEFEDIPPSVYSTIDLKYLLVRFGVSEQTKQSPVESPHLKANLNKIVGVDTSYSERTQTITAHVPFCVHKRHAVEFKFFVDVSDPDDLAPVKQAFSASASCTSASISDSLKDRVYMVHKAFRTTVTDSGFVNNVIYPQ